MNDAVFYNTLEVKTLNIVGREHWDNLTKPYRVNRISFLVSVTQLERQFDKVSNVFAQIKHKFGGYLIAATPDYGLSQHELQGVLYTFVGPRLPYEKSHLWLIRTKELPPSRTHFRLEFRPVRNQRETPLLWIPETKIVIPTAHTEAMRKAYA